MRSLTLDRLQPDKRGVVMQGTANAVIIGGGVMGCSILYNLAARGMRDLVLLEKDVLGAGSTGKSQAICRMHYSNRLTAQMAWESLKVYRDFGEVVGGSSGFARTGYLVVVGAEDRQALDDNISMQRSLGINTGLVSHEDVGEIAPMLNVEDAAGLAFEPESGYADPYLTARSYAIRAGELGAQVHTRTPATDIEITGGRVSAVVTEQGRIETPNAIIASGPWSSRFFAKLGLPGVDVPLATIRHQVVAIRRPEDQIPSHPIVGDIAQQFSFRPDPTNLTLIGIGEDEADPDTYNQAVDMEVVGEAFGKLVHRMPAAADGLFRGGWSGLFTITPDWHPVLDSFVGEGIQGLYCAVGFSGHGFKLAPMIGVTMAELVMEGRSSTIDISPLRMGRFREGDLLTSRYRYNVLA